MKRFVLFFALAAGIIGVAAPAAERPAVLISPHVRIAGIPVGGLTSERARALVERRFEQPLHFASAKQRWRATPARLGSSADVDDAITRALRAQPGAKILLRVDVRRDRVESYVDRLDRMLSYPARDSKLVGLAGVTPSITVPENGLAVRKQFMARTITRALHLGWRGPFTVATRSVAPRVTQASFGPIIVIERGSNQLSLYEGTQLSQSFRVATGQTRYPTPTGWFSVVDKQRDPWWRPPNSDWAQGLKPIPPGPGNPLGTRWMGLSAPGVGIHGTPDAASIGYSASHGCIRMFVPDAERLFDRVDIGTPVFIVDA